jgi:Flp pilus assembly protein TadG
LHQRVYGLLDAIARVWRDNRGASATIVAITLPVLIGFGSLGAETGLWYTIKRQNQSAADAAAISAAYEVIAGKTNLTNNLTPAASEAAIQNGYTGTAPLVVHPYSDSIVQNGVAVTLQQTQPGLLASLFLPSVTIATKAVAVIKVFDNPCILALATSGTDVEVGASSSLDAPTCSVAANSTSRSSINIQSSTGSITAATLVTPGEISLNGNPINPASPPSEFALTSRPLIGAPSVVDPYAGRLTHAFLIRSMPITGNCTKTGATTYSGSCVIAGSSLTSGTWTLSPNAPGMQISGGLTVNGTVNLKPGTYWITDGNLTLQPNAFLKCSFCTIILTTLKSSGGTVGRVQIPSGATVTLQAPNSGTFSGLLFIQDRVAPPTGNSVLEGGPNMNLTGLLYLPNTAVGFQGNPSATCTVLITEQVAIHGNSNFTTSGCKKAGLTRLPAVNTVALAE